MDGIFTILGLILGCVLTAFIMSSRTFTVKEVISHKCGMYVVAPETGLVSFKWQDEE